jgi:hypothetical protein
MVATEQGFREKRGFLVIPLIKHPYLHSLQCCGEKWPHNHTPNKSRLVKVHRGGKNCGRADRNVTSEHHTCLPYGMADEMKEAHLRQVQAAYLPFLPSERPVENLQA